MAEPPPARHGKCHFFLVSWFTIWEDFLKNFVFKHKFPGNLVTRLPNFFHAPLSFLFNWDSIQARKGSLRIPTSSSCIIQLKIIASSSFDSHCEAHLSWSIRMAHAQRQTNSAACIFSSQSLKGITKVGTFTLWFPNYSERTMGEV